MADVKWIKLATGLPDNRKIKQIRKLPQGDTIALMWVFLMCLAGETNDDGMVYFMPEIPYTDEMLAEQFKIDVNTVRLALATFQRFGMIEIVEDIICLSSWEKWQAVDKLSEMREKTRKRVAKHRQKRAALLAQNQCAYCGSAATGYDHIIATARGGTDTEENKVYCCGECNRIKNDKPLVSFLNANRERIDDDLVASNQKLQRFVTLCNVTGRYIVTQGNAIEEDKDLEEESDKKKEIRPLTVSNDTVRSTDVQRTIEAWNALGLNQIRDIKSGTNRYTQYKKRVKDYGIETVIEAIRQIANSSFLKGGGKNGFIITFDWFIAPNNFVKVLEGNYTDKEARNYGEHRGNAEERSRLERVGTWY